MRRRRSGSPPQALLWDAIEARWPGVASLEHAGAVPGRRYRIDIAFPAARLAVEVDGWEWHGKHKADFARDRERQNLLTLHGWRVLRFTAGEIRKSRDACVEIIAQALAIQPAPGDSCLHQAACGCQRTNIRSSAPASSIT